MRAPGNVAARFSAIGLVSYPPEKATPTRRPHESAGLKPACSSSASFVASAARVASASKTSGSPNASSRMAGMCCVSSPKPVFGWPKTLSLSHFVAVFW
jgi:hypothetical protein